MLYIWKRLYTSATSAADSAAKAEASIEKLGTHEANAATSASNAATSAEHAKTSETNAKASETDAKTSATNAKTSETNSKTSETNARTSETNASNSADLAKAWAESSGSPDSVNDADSTTGKTQSSKSWALYARDRAISAYSSETSAATSAEHAKASEAKAKTSETNAATSAEHAATSEANASISEANAKTSETNAKTSETNAATSAEHAATSEGNTREYMEKAQTAYESAKAIQSVVDIAKADAEKCVADVEAVRDSLAKMMTYQGSVDNYSDLPENPQVGYSYNVKNADKEHGVNAGDNVVWNGESWDNLGGSVDMSLFAELGKDVKFNTVTATTFTGNLKGNADTATKATQDADGNVIADTYYKKSDASTIHQSFQNQINTKQDKLTFDSTPTANSHNPVTSDGIRKAIDEKTVDLSNYYTKTQVNTAVSAAKTEIEEKIPAVTVSGNTISFGSVTIGVD